MSIRMYKKFKVRSKTDFKGRHFNGLMIIQAVNCYLRYASLLEKRLRGFRKPHCGEARIDETYIKVKVKVSGNIYIEL